eukprot:UN10730
MAFVTIDFDKDVMQNVDDDNDEFEDVYNKATTLKLSEIADEAEMDGIHNKISISLPQSSPTPNQVNINSNFDSSIN